MTRSTSAIPTRLFAVAAAAGGTALAALIGARASAATSSGFLLIDRGLRTQPVRVVEIDEGTLIYRDAAGQLRPALLGECVALIRAAPPPAPSPAAGGGPASTGLLVLTDGQRFPGTVAAGSFPDEERVAWSHPWLERIDVPLDRVSAVSFRPGRAALDPGESDLVVLTNGDRLSGFITSLGDSITIEVEIDGAPQRLRIPLERAVAVGLVTPAQSPAGRRLWFIDGTKLDASGLSVTDDGFMRLVTAWTEGSTQVRLSDMTAVLFDPAALVPLARITPSSPTSPVPRFYVPPPRRLDDDAPLDLARLEYRGPLLVRYPLPPGCVRFAAEAILPRAARQWGDCELVVRDDDREVFRARLNAEEPRAVVNVPLRGSELSIEFTQGANGPLQDRVVLTRAMLLVE